MQRLNAAEFGVDVAQLQVKVNEGSLYPTVTVTGSTQQQYHPTDSTLRFMNASVDQAIDRANISGRLGIFAGPSGQG